MINIFSKYLFTAFLLLIFIVIHIKADDRANARGIALANSTLLSSTGIDAFGLNPSNFDYMKERNKKKSEWQISVFSVGGGYGSDTSLNFYNDYLSKLSIRRETFTNIFTDITSVLEFRQKYLPNEETDVNYDFELKWFSVNYSNPKYGGFNFTVTDRVGLNTSVLSRDDYLPLTFTIYPHPDSSYDLTNVSMHQSEAIAWWIRKYTFGYAKHFNLGKRNFINGISVGFSAGLVHGFGNVITYNSSLDVSTYGIKSTSQGSHVDSIKGYQNFRTQSALTDYFADYSDGAESHFNFFPKPAGTGYTFDFGITFNIGDFFRFGFSATDLGKIKWDYNTITNYDSESFAYYDFYLNSSDQTYNLFVNDLEGLDTRDTVSAFETRLPTKFRTGIFYKPSDKFTAEVNLIKGDNNLPGNSTKWIISAGTEFTYVPYFPIRFGFSAGGAENWNIALGFGLKLKHVIIDIGTNNINGIVSNKRISVSFSSKILF